MIGAQYCSKLHNTSYFRANHCRFTEHKLFKVGCFLLLLSPRAFQVGKNGSERVVFFLGLAAESHAWMILYTHDSVPLFLFVLS
jgi:hypothetical protein